MSNCVLLRSHARQDMFWIVVDSPAPIEASVMACDHMYCVCHESPCESLWLTESCNALKVLLPSFVFKPKEPNPASGRVPVAGLMRFTVYLEKRWWPTLPT